MYLVFVFGIKFPWRLNIFRFWKLQHKKHRLWQRIRYLVKYLLKKAMSWLWQRIIWWNYCFVGIIVDSTSNVAFALWKEINFLIILWWSFKDPNDQEVWTVKFHILLTQGCRRWPPQCGWRTGPARRSPRAPPQGQGQAGMRGFRMFFFGFIVNAKFPCPLKICIQIYKVFLCIFNFFQMQCWHVFICIKICKVFIS